MSSAGEKRGKRRELLLLRSTIDVPFGSHNKRERKDHKAIAPMHQHCIMSRALCTGIESIFIFSGCCCCCCREVSREVIARRRCKAPQQSIVEPYGERLGRLAHAYVIYINTTKTCFPLFSSLFFLFCQQMMMRGLESTALLISRWISLSSLYAVSAGSQSLYSHQVNSKWEACNKTRTCHICLSLCYEKIF